MGLALTTPPAAEPLTTAEAKSHLAVTSSDDDAYIDALITSARSAIEAATRRALITQTHTLTRRAFGAEQVLLPRPPLQSVTSVKYYPSGGGAQETLAAGTDYRVNTAGTIGSIERVEGTSWPALADRHDAVEIVFVAGYGAAGSALPAALLHAIRLQLSEMFEPQHSAKRGEAIASLTLLHKVYSATAFEALQ